jgi:hypothetical protein
MLERASDFVRKLKGDEKIELFNFMVDVFDLKDHTLILFAKLCDFPIAEVDIHG